MANRIHNIVTNCADGDGQEDPVIMMGLDIDDLDDLDAFMRHVADRFRYQRMISPPETSAMFVTLIGTLTTEEFKRRWAKEVERDPILEAFMARMESASVLHGERDGAVISEISLIDRGN